MVSDKLAFLDLDRTLIDYLSLNELCRRFEKEGLVEIPDAQWMEMFQQQRWAGLLSYEEIVEAIGKRLAAYTTGYTPEELEPWFELCTEEAEHHLFPWVPEAIQVLRERGFAVILVSASVTPFVSRIGKKLGLKEVFASSLEIQNGVYMGKLLTLFDGQAKRALVERLTRRRRPTCTIAIGDSHGDLPMLETVDTPLLYEPRHAELVTHAAECGWQVVTRHTVLEAIRNL